MEVIWRSYCPPARESYQQTLISCFYASSNYLTSLKTSLTSIAKSCKIVDEVGEIPANCVVYLDVVLYT